MTATRARGVLIIEDESEIRSLFAMLLASESFPVFEAEDGLDALRLLEEHREEIGVIMTDLNLPRLGGPALIARLRATAPSAKILATSGYGDEEVRMRVRQSGAAEFLAKPFRPDAAIAAVKRLLEVP